MCLPPRDRLNASAPPTASGHRGNVELGATVDLEAGVPRGEISVVLEAWDDLHDRLPAQLASSEPFPRPLRADTPNLQASAPGLISSTAEKGGYCFLEFPSRCCRTVVFPGDPLLTEPSTAVSMLHQWWFGRPYAFDGRAAVHLSQFAGARESSPGSRDLGISFAEHARRGREGFKSNLGG